MRNRFGFNYDTWKQLMILKWKIEFMEPTKEVKDHLLQNFKKELPYLAYDLYDKSQIKKIYLELISGLE